MSRAEAKAVASQVLYDLRQLTYERCQTLMNQVETKVVTGSDGKEYQVEIQAVWDDQRKKNIRVMVSADSTGIEAILPSTVSFIIAPDGAFVGE